MEKIDNLPAYNWWVLIGTPSGNNWWLDWWKPQSPFALMRSSREQYVT